MILIESKNIILIINHHLKFLLTLMLLNCFNPLLYQVLHFKTINFHHQIKIIILLKFNFPQPTNLQLSTNLINLIIHFIVNYYYFHPKLNYLIKLNNQSHLLFQHFYYPKFIFTLYQVLIIFIYYFF